MEGKTTDFGKRGALLEKKNAGILHFSLAFARCWLRIWKLTWAVTQPRTFLIAAFFSRRECGGYAAVTRRRILAVCYFGTDIYF